MLRPKLLKTVFNDRFRIECGLLHPISENLQILQGGKKRVTVTPGGAGAFLCLPLACLDANGAKTRVNTLFTGHCLQCHGAPASRGCEWFVSRQLAKIGHQFHSPWPFEFEPGGGGRGLRSDLRFWR